MPDERPQPRHVDAVGGEIVHEAELELVVVDGRGEVAVQDLEAVVGRHVEGVLDVLDGDRRPWARRRWPPTGRGRRASPACRACPRAMTVGVIRALRVEQAARLQQRRSASRGRWPTVGTGFPFTSTVSRRGVEDRLELGGAPAAARCRRPRSRAPGSRPSSAGRRRRAAPSPVRRGCRPGWTRAAGSGSSGTNMRPSRRSRSLSTTMARRASGLYRERP